ncbi:hypothetical protein [Ruegeria marina]|uniref:Uncharacterized protein n=1 Tax=Ruegeria marina TaxID=639004 RepID=A0A1G7CU01_9RHOB|nr:hypothetical protein [Ruegeria marina]SDE42723.1 hypothetical protein SAMN04488239_11920 [Ruegeria marina]
MLNLPPVLSLIAVLSALVPHGSRAASLFPSGCEILREAAEPTCMAKVDCGNQVEAIETATSAFQLCTEGKTMSASEAQSILRQFTNVRYYQCCAGNAWIHQTQLQPKN